MAGDDENLFENGTNPFVFGNWQPVLVVSRKSTSSTDYLEKVLYNLGLLHSKQMSGLATTEFLNTTSNLESTRNAPTALNTRIAYYKKADEVYAMSERDGSKAAVDKPTKADPNNLTPMIMVVDTIPSVKSRILLKVLLDSGSTTTMINRKCLPKIC